MSPLDDGWLLSEAQMRRIEPYFPLSHGVPRVDDRRVVSGIIYVIRNGLMVDATHLKAHRTATSLLKKRLFPDVSAEPKAA